MQKNGRLLSNQHRDFQPYFFMQKQIRRNNLVVVSIARSEKLFNKKNQFIIGFCNRLSPMTLISGTNGPPV